MAITEDSNISLKVSTIVTWVAAIIVTVGGSTFALTRASISDHVEALEEKLDSSSTEGQLPLPDISGKPDRLNPELRGLAERISNLEKERGVLVQELLLKSNKTLEPGSELAGLILQVSSDSSQHRMKGAEGLFLLNDPITVPTLVAYLNSNRAEALNVRYMFQWYDMLWQVDPQAAIVVGINELTSDIPENAEEAFKELHEHIWSNAPALESRQRIESIALTSNDSLVRTRAKLLIQRLEDRVAFNAETEAQKIQREEEVKQGDRSIGYGKASRSIRDILLGIESKLGIEIPKDLGS